ncbi:MAG: hypothetical protein EOO40_11115 [Deltaproteobacteria bacterium]|nr:MAG: hypothetical protein EOO40_11115 [Deltaproteobacteria bacterium]
MPICQVELLERMATVAQDLELSISACDPDEPMSVAYGMLEARQYLTELHRMLRTYDRQEELREADD